MSGARAREFILLLVCPIALLRPPQSHNCNSYYKPKFSGGRRNSANLAAELPVCCESIRNNSFVRVRAGTRLSSSAFVKRKNKVEEEEAAE